MTQYKHPDPSHPLNKHSGADDKSVESARAEKVAQTGQSRQSEHQPGQKSAAPRGFAAMDQNKQRDIASAGGRAAHEKGTAHEFDSEEARIAGRKGGEVVSENREHMAEIGRKGGEARQAAASGNRTQDRSRAAAGQQPAKPADIKPGESKPGDEGIKNR